MSAVYAIDTAKPVRVVLKRVDALIAPTHSSNGIRLAPMAILVTTTVSKVISDIF